MNSLYLFMNVYESDANDILNTPNRISAMDGINSIDEELSKLQIHDRTFLQQSFMYMIQQANKLALR